MTKYEKEHRENLQRIATEIDDAFYDFSYNIARQKSKVNLTDDLLKWTSFVGLSAFVDKQIKKLVSRIEKSSYNSIYRAFSLSEKYDKDISKKYEPKRKFSFFKTSKIEKQAKGYFRDLKLSDRVWHSQYKNEIRLAIDTAFRTGKSQEQLAREIRRYLREPDRLYKRVRDNHGKLVLSKAMKEYHPGRGVYRSSYRNAMRLATDELNRAYREAEWEMWQKKDYIVGFRVSVTPRKNSTCPLCEELQGVYPKSFKWYAWHPNCRCYVTPIYADTQENIFRGNYSTQQPPMPDNFKTWIRVNSPKIQEANKRGTAPFFIRDNKKTIDNFLRENKTSIQEVKDLMNKAKASATEIDSLAKGIAIKYGGYATPIDLKSKASILRKLNNELEGDISQIKDAVRNTIIVPQKNIKKCIDYLQKNDIFARLKIQTPDKFMGYSGVLSNVKTSHNILGEIQVNTEKMIYAKEPKKVAINIIGKKKWHEIRKETGLEGGLGHKYYEEWRLLDKNNPRRKELEKLSNDYYKHFR